MSLLLLLAQVPAPAPGADVFGWVLESLKWTVEQFKDKNYMPAVGMLLMVLIWAFNTFFSRKVKKELLPLVAAGLGVLSACAMNLMALAAGYSTMGWLSAVAQGLTMGAAASGFWSLVGKKIAGKLPLAPPQDGD